MQVYAITLAHRQTSMRNKTQVLNKESDSREGEGKRTISIRPVSLRRAQIITSIIDNENVTDFISNAVDQRAKAMIKSHGITLPKDAAFESA